MFHAHDHGVGVTPEQDPARSLFVRLADEIKKTDKTPQPVKKTRGTEAKLDFINFDQPITPPQDTTAVPLSDLVKGNDLTIGREHFHHLGDDAVKALRDAGINRISLLSIPDGKRLVIEKESSSKVEMDPNTGVHALYLGTELSADIKGTANGSVVVDNIKGLSAKVDSGNETIGTITVSIDRIEFAKNADGQLEMRVTGSKFGFTKEITIPLDLLDANFTRLLICISTLNELGKNEDLTPPADVLEKASRAATTIRALISLGGLALIAALIYAIRKKTKQPSGKAADKPADKKATDNKPVSDKDNVEERKKAAESELEVLEDQIKQLEKEIGIDKQDKAFMQQLREAVAAIENPLVNPPGDAANGRTPAVPDFRVVADGPVRSVRIGEAIYYFEGAHHVYPVQLPQPSSYPGEVKTHVFAYDRADLGRLQAQLIPELIKAMQPGGRLHGKAVYFKMLDPLMVTDPNYKSNGWDFQSSTQSKAFTIYCADAAACREVTEHINRFLQEKKLSNPTSNSDAPKDAPWPRTTVTRDLYEIAWHGDTAGAVLPTELSAAVHDFAKQCILQRKPGWESFRNINEIYQKDTNHQLKPEVLSLLNKEFGLDGTETRLEYGETSAENAKAESKLMLVTPRSKPLEEAGEKIYLDESKANGQVVRRSDGSVHTGVTGRFALYEIAKVAGAALGQNLDPARMCPSGADSQAHFRFQVQQCLANTPATQLQRLLETRTEEKRAGSYWEALTPSQLHQALKEATWEPYNPLDAQGNPIIKPPARGLRAEIPGGRLGMTSLDALPPGAKVHLIDPKGIGAWSVSVPGAAEPKTTMVTMILGPGADGREMVWTAHPGEPVAPSPVTNDALTSKGISLDGLPKDGVDRRIEVTVEQARQMGFGMAKIEAPASVPAAPTAEQRQASIEFLQAERERLKEAVKSQSPQSDTLAEELKTVERYLTEIQAGDLRNFQALQELVAKRAAAANTTNLLVPGSGGSEKTGAGSIVVSPLKPGGADVRPTVLPTDVVITGALGALGGASTPEVKPPPAEPTLTKDGVIIAGASKSEKSPFDIMKESAEQSLHDSEAKLKKESEKSHPDEKVIAALKDGIKKEKEALQLLELCMDPKNTEARVEGMRNYVRGAQEHSKVPLSHPSHRRNLVALSWIILP